MGKSRSISQLHLRLQVVVLNLQAVVLTLPGLGPGAIQAVTVPDRGSVVHSWQLQDESFRLQLRSAGSKTNSYAILA